MNRRLIGASALCGCAMTAIAGASSYAADSSSIPEIVVTATRTALPLAEVPASVSVITSTQILDTPAQGLDDILQQVPGMTLNMIGPDVGHPTAYNEAMRGLPPTNTRMLVLLDGVPVNDPGFGYIQWNRIPLDNIDQVEIVRGGGSPLWGNGALGGVVNVITRAPNTQELLIDSSGGSYGTYQTSAYGAYLPTDAIRLSANAAFSGTNGYQTTPASWNSFGTTTLRAPVYTPTTFDAKNGELRGDLDLPDDFTAWAKVNYHENHQVLSTPIGDDFQHVWTYTGEVKRTFTEGSSLELTVFHDDSNFVTNNPHLLSFTTEYNSNTHTTPIHDTGASLVWSQNLSGVLRNYTIGADVHDIAGADYANYYNPSGQLAAPTIIGSGKQLFIGGFAQVRVVPIEKLEILASVREQYYRNFDGLDTFPPAIGVVAPSHQYSFDPRINARYGITDDFAIRGAYYTSFRAPTLNELYRTYADTTAGIYEGNPFLKAETLRGEEVGFDFNRPGLRSQLTFYTSHIQNLITSENLTADENPTSLGVNCGYDPQTFTYLTCTRNINAAAAIARGIEAEVTWDIGSGFSTVLEYTFADSRYTSNPVDPAAVGQRLEGVPKHTATGNLTYAAPSGWRVSAQVRWVSQTYGDPFPADNLILNAHFLADASAAYPVTRNVQVYAQIQNILDSRYIANNSGGPPILGTPFEILGGVRVKLQ